VSHKNTLASYRGALRYWAAWFALRYRQPLTLPVAEATVLQFIVDHIQRTTDGCLVHELPDSIDQVLVSQGFKGKLGPLALSTVARRLAASCPNCMLCTQPLIPVATKGCGNSSPRPGGHMRSAGRPPPAKRR
jgi:hypothetical protein